MPMLYTFVKNPETVFNSYPKPPHFVSVVAQSEAEARNLLGRMSIVFVSRKPLALSN